MIIAGFFFGCRPAYPSRLKRIMRSFPHYFESFPLGFLSGLCQYVVMVCIYCAQSTRIINSRPQKRLNHTWRRRQCEHCLTIFTTIESPDLGSSIVVGEGPRFEPFDRDRLFASLLRSLGHRSDAVVAASSLTATITTQVLKTVQHARIESKSIVRITSETLSHFDSAAQTHYDAYHPR